MNDTQENRANGKWSFVKDERNCTYFYGPELVLQNMFVNTKTSDTEFSKIKIGENILHFKRQLLQGLKMILNIIKSSYEEQA